MFESDKSECQRTQSVQACDEVTVDNHEKTNPKKKMAALSEEKINLWFLPLIIYSSLLIAVALNHEQRIK